jgi:hypothetical protein
MWLLLGFAAFAAEGGVVLSDVEPADAPASPRHTPTPGASTTVSVRGSYDRAGYAGVEVRTDGVVFARGRLYGYDGGPAGLFDVISEVSGEPAEDRFWLGRGVEVELAWAPIPGARLGVAVDSRRSFSGKALETMMSDYAIVPDTVGVTRVGPEVAGGHTTDRWSLVGVASWRAPVASRWAAADGVRPTRDDGTAYRQREMQGAVALVGAEARWFVEHLVLGVEGGVTATSPSRYRRDLDVPAGTRTAPWAAATVGVGW